MPDPDDKKIEIDNTVKNEIVANVEKQRKLRDALIDEMAQERAQQRAIDSQVRREEYDEKAAKYWDDGGNDPTTCVASWVRANCGTGKGFESYHDFTSCMMSLCAGYALLNKAMAYDNLGERGMKFIWAHTLDGTTAGQVLEGLAGMPGQLVDKAGDKILRGVGARKSPVLVYSVNIDENGKLTTEATKNGEPLSFERNIPLGTNSTTGKPEFISEQMLFDTGLVAWLDVRGWEFDGATQQIKDKNDNNNIMTPEKFAELSQDDENGLTAFFEDRMEVEITQAPRPF